MTWYRTGTVSVTNGWQTITGSGTAWIGSVKVGDAFIGPDGGTYEINSLVSNTAFTVVGGYLGASMSGASYTVVPTQSRLADLSGQVGTLINSFQSASDVAAQFNSTIIPGYDAQIAAKLVEIQGIAGNLPAALVKKVYVDQVNGDDAASGTVGSPLRTIGKAMTDHAIPFGQTEISLKSDYTTVNETTRWFFPFGGTVILSSEGSTERILTLNTMPYPNSSSHYVKCFEAGLNSSPIALQIKGIRVKFPPEEVSQTMFGDQQNSLISTFGTAGPAMVHLSVTGCTLEMPTNGEGCLLGALTRTGSLVIESTTLVGNFAGKYIAGVVAGTATKDVSRILANINTL